MTRLELPIGIQTFRTIREGGFYYVDKTPWIRRMVKGGSRFFLSRPRRFGKSLLLDTLKELFEGGESLFRGLDIHKRWDWSVRHPVLRISFGGDNFRDEGQLHSYVMAELDALGEQLGVGSRYESGPARLGHLIREAHRATGRRVVVLVDEYDKPILDVLDWPDTAMANRDYLRGLYSVIKDRDAHVRFVFLAGVSKFSKVSLFSGLNNLRDITLDCGYSAVCGYTERDLDEVFGPELPGLDRDRIREWYNGYGWLGADRVYNPFDILLLFDLRRFRAHWFETGSPAFLVETLMKRQVASPLLEDMIATDEVLGAFDIDGISTEALLFQTGYLTITEETETEDGPMYRLGYPNREVRLGLNRHIAGALGADPAWQLRHSPQLREVLRAADFGGLESLMRAFLAGIPYEWHARNDIARYEGYYASLFYSWFTGAGLDLSVEESTSRGRLDMAVRVPDTVHIFEFKVARKGRRGGPGAAMEQLRAKGYAEKFRAPGTAVHLVGVELDPETRNVGWFGVERG